MGKSNRIRNNRATQTMNLGVKPKKKSGIPGWATNLIAIAVAVVIFASAALSLMLANGTFSRWQTAAKTENFRVNANMMQYYFNTQYSSFVSENSSYLTYYGLDTGSSLKGQLLDTSDATKGTWFDYMVTMTKTQVAEMLAYCEEAKARGIELTDEDMESVEAELSVYEAYAEMYGYTNTNNYVAAVYGEGMKLKDIRDAVELSMLASKCAGIVGDEIEGAITDDVINTKYNENKLNYHMADYMTFTFDVSYEDAIVAVLGEDYDKTVASEKSAEIIAKYKEMIAAERAKAAELAGKTTVEDFKAVIYDSIASDVYDDSYDAVNDDNDTLTEDKLPSAEDLATIKTKLMAHVIDLIKNDKDYEKLTVTEGETNKVFDIAVTAEFAEFFETFAAQYHSDFEYNVSKYVLNGAIYDETDDAIKWIFEDGRATGDIKSFEDGDGADNAELSTTVSELDKFSVSVYYVTKPQYRDETKTKNVGILAFATEDEAKAVLSSLSAGMTLDAFKALAGENGSFTDYTDYVEGTMGVSAFDTWIYGENTAVGAVTTEAIKLSDSTYAVALYYADGNQNWYVSVKGDIYSENVEDFSSALTAKYTVTYNDKALAKLEG